MPAAIAVALSTVVVGTITVGQIVFAVASFAISSAMANRAQKKAEAAQRAAAEQQRAAFNAGLVDRTTVIRSAIQPRNIILGRDEASGPLACWFTYGPLRNFHAFGVVLAGHECDAIETIMFNHEPVTLDGSGAVIAPAKYVRVISNTYSESFPEGQPVVLSRTPTRIDSTAVVMAMTQGGENPVYTTFTNVNYTVVETQPLFYIRKYLGSPGQAAAPELIAAAAAAGIPGAWDASRKGTGICYVTCVMEADYNILGQIGVPNISAVTRGVRAYDPRLDATAWTRNPALLARWLMVNSGFAPKTLHAEVHAGELLASANVCDEGLYFSPTRLDQRYQANGQLTSAASPLDNLNHILDAMDGDAVWISGQWQIIAGYYREPTLEINEDTLSGAGITVAPRTAKRDLFNAVKGTFVNVYAGYTRMAYDMVTSDVYQAQDGDELLPAEVNFELVNEPARCQMIAWQRLARARQPLTLQLGTTLKGYDSAPLHTVNVNLARLGYANKVFTNLRREFENNTLVYVLQETGPEVWNWNYAMAGAGVDIPNTSLPDVSTIPVPTGVQIESGTAVLKVLGDGTVISRARVRWDQITNSYVRQGGKVEWQHKSATVLSDDWTTLAAVPGGDVEIFTGELVDRDLMLFRGRCVTGQGRQGDWCPVVSHTVIGKTERPPDVSSFAVALDGLASWPTMTGVPDLAGFQIRWQPGNNRSWGDATPLHTGLLPGGPYMIQIRPTVTATFMIKAFDTSQSPEFPLGNESRNVAASVINLGDPLVANVILAYDYKAASWPGVYTGATVVGGNLVATADASPLAWDPNPNTAGWTLDSDPGWSLDTYGAVTYRPDVFIVDDADAGAQLTLPNEIAGAAYLIEYRRDGDAPGWTGDTEPGWTNDDDPAWSVEAWRPWPGSVVAQGGRYEAQVTIQSRDVQGVISALAFSLDVEDQFENVGLVSVLAGGTVIPTAKTWRHVEIGLTLVADGGTARTARIENRATRTVTTRDDTNSAVNGTVTATLQGY